MSDLADLIRSTRDLIAERGQQIALSRPQMTRTMAGGTARRPGAALNPVRRYFAGVSVDARRTTTLNGEVVVLNYVLIGLPGDDIQEKDEFTIRNRKFLVAEVDPNQDFQVKGWVTEYA